VNREVRKIVKAARKQGCRIKETGGGGHVQILTPNGGIVTVSSSPSDERAYKNMRSDLRRQGVRV